MANTNGFYHERNGVSKRTPSVNIEDLPVTLPVANIPTDVDIIGIARSQIERLGSLSSEDLTETAFWRDSLALTGTFRTFYGGHSVARAWRETSDRHRPADFALNLKSAHAVRHGPQLSWIEAGFTFRTTAGKILKTCSGFLSIVPGQDGDWKIWLVRTILEQLQGHGNVDVLDVLESRPRSGTEGQSVNDANGISHQKHFDCVVVGGGQAGLSTAGRLKALGVSYVVVDRHPRVGDSWNTRYDSVKLHTAREYAHLPFERTFGPEYPEFLTKNHLAAGYRKYVEKFGINIWCSTELSSSSWNEQSQTWTCSLRREGQEQRITAHHLIFAIGAGSQFPKMPEYPNREHFRGTVLHSADYKSSCEWKGKDGIIVGSANTAHDVAEDMVKEGLSSVTMVQRGSTWVLPVEYYMRVSVPLYNENIPTETADRLSFSNPMAVYRLIAMTHLQGMARAEPERFDALERVGFKVERYGDIAKVLYVTMGGHYMDVGCSAKIAEGLVGHSSAPLFFPFPPFPLHYAESCRIDQGQVRRNTNSLHNLRSRLQRRYRIENRRYCVHDRFRRRHATAYRCHRGA
jgi:Pyridine nucleotide-disulphide oxidoreductase